MFRYDILLNVTYSCSITSFPFCQLVLFFPNGPPSTFIIVGGGCAHTRTHACAYVYTCVLFKKPSAGGDLGGSCDLAIVSNVAAQKMDMQVSVLNALRMCPGVALLYHTLTLI